MKKISRLFILIMCLGVLSIKVNAATVAVGNGTVKEKEVTLELKDDKDTENNVNKFKMVTFELSVSGTASDNINDFVTSIKVTPTSNTISKFEQDLSTKVYKFINVDGLNAGSIGTIEFIVTDQLTESFTITPTNVKFYSEADETAEDIVISDGGVISGTIKYEKPKSTDATLTELTVSQGTLTPAFNKDITEYTVSVPDTISIIRISASAAIGATRTGTGSKNLVIGENAFSIEVTAEDGVTKKTYNITVTRGKVIEPSAFIKTLKITGLDEGELSPEFDSKNDKYTIVVPNGTESLNIDYELEDPLANIAIEGNEKFVVGENKVKITVTSSDGSKKQTYEILVTVNEPETTTTTTTAPAPVAPKKKNNKWLLFAIILAVVCILTVVAILLFRKKKDDKDEEQVETPSDSINKTSESIVLANEQENKMLYDEEKTETYDRSTFAEQLKSSEEELDKTKEFNFKDM